MSDTLISFWVFLFAWFFQAFTGFGAGIFIVGILSLTLDPKTVIVSSAPINLIGTLFMAFLLMRRVRPNWRVLGTLILGSVPGIFLGGKLLLLLERDTLKLIIGLFILSLGLYDLLVQKGSLRRFKLERGLITGAGAGFMGGFFAGLIGMGGPPPVVYLNQVLDDVEEFKSTLTLFFTSNIIFRLLAYGVQGGLEFIEASLVVSAALAVPLGILSGLYTSRMIKPQRLKEIISFSVLFLGIMLIFEP